VLLSCPCRRLRVTAVPSSLAFLSIARFAPLFYVFLGNRGMDCIDICETTVCTCSPFVQEHAMEPKQPHKEKPLSSLYGGFRAPAKGQKVRGKPARE
jgi:hypothetical protein